MQVVCTTDWKLRKADNMVERRRAQKVLSHNDSDDDDNDDAASCARGFDSRSLSVWSVRSVCRFVCMSATHARGFDSRTPSATTTRRRSNEDAPRQRVATDATATTWAAAFTHNWLPRRFCLSA